MPMISAVFIYMLAAAGAGLPEGAAGGVRWTVPAGWEASGQRPMRVATYRIPATAGQEAGECGVFFFGRGQGGSVEDNLARQPSDYTRFFVIAPLDDRLPGGGGHRIDNLFDPNQNVASLNDDYATYAPNFGKQYQVYNGLEMSLSARLRYGLQFQVGSSTGESIQGFEAV